MSLSLAAPMLSAFSAPLASTASRAGSVSMMAKSQAIPSLDRRPGLDADTYIGVGRNAGDVGFDPLGFSNHELGPFDTAAEHMAWIREAEIKHGRVCMLAVLGWIGVDLGVKAPGLPAGLKGLSAFQAHDAAVAQGPLIVLLMFCGVFEIAGSGGIAASLKGERVPGDFALTGGFGKTPESLAKLRENEIAHCRLAMMAFSGIVTQSAVFGGLPFPYDGHVL